MATGDVRGVLRKLQASLRTVKYPREVDYQSLARGDPASCLPIVSYAFTSFSSALAEHLVERGIELTGKNDLRFIETVYKVLRDFFNYKPLLSKQQFLQYGFAERKVSLLCDIIGFVVDKHKQLTKGSKPVSQPRRRQLSRSDSKTAECSPPKEVQRMAFQSLRHPQSLLSRPLVERHVGCSTPAQFSLSSDDHPQSPRQEGEEEEEEEEEEERREPYDGDSPQPAAHTAWASDGALRAVETGLQECVCRLEKQLSLLDGRLQALEKSVAGKIVIERSDWENLESRVLLLETRLALNSTQRGDTRTDPSGVGGALNEPGSLEQSHLSQKTVSASAKEALRCSTVGLRSSFQFSSDSHSPASPPPSSSEENIKERLERIASMMKDTSSLLKDIEPTI